MIPVIDSDSHVSEPPDLWTSRVPRKFGDRVPHVYHDDRRNIDRWLVGGKRLTGVGGWAMAGWPEYPPSHPATVDEMDPGAWQPVQRAQRMDEYGVTTQVVYPNLLAFFPYAFLSMQDSELQLACVQAYNDFLTEFAQTVPGRFIPLTALPFWDVEASVKEMIRCAEMGHKGIVFASKPYKIGFPRLAEPHWDPILATAQEIGHSVNFHVGFQEMNEDDLKSMIGLAKYRSDYAKDSSLSLLGNAEAIADVIMSGIAHRYPNLNFVSVESGYGWLPYFVEAMNWQWLNSGAAKEHPERLMPDEYFRRQIFGSFWFERESIARLADLYPDNIMFETDYPHPTSLSPGPASSSENPRDMIRKSIGGLPDEIQRKILFETAARLYHVEVADTVEVGV